MNCNNCNHIIYSDEFFSISCKKNKFKNINITDFEKYSKNCEFFNDTNYKKREEENKKALADYYKEIKRLEDKKDLFLNNLKQEISEILYEEILSQLTESENTIDYCFVKKPVGEYVKLNNDKLKGYYVNQYVNGGFTGDTFEGDCYIKISDNKYFKFSYNM